MKRGMGLKFNDHFLAWAFIYSISVFLALKSLLYLNLNNNLIAIFLTGLIITLFSWIMYSLLYYLKNL